MAAVFSHLPVLLKTSGEASVLILLVLVAQWLCGPRLRPRWRHVLWLLVLLRLALPWTIPSPTSLFNLFKAPAMAPAVVTETMPVQAHDAAPVPAHTAQAAAPRKGGRWLLWIWAAGAAAVAGGCAANLVRFRRRVVGRRPLTDGPTLDLLEDCKLIMGVAAPITLVETPAVTSPLLFGFLRPRLLLPQGMVSRFTPQELKHVFLHELAHVKRFDILTGWLSLGLQIVHWFNPLVWLAFHRLRADRELACDALALSRVRTGENQAYGLTVVKLLDGFAQPAWGPGLAGILEVKHQMKERIRMIAKFHDNNGGLGLAGLLLAGLTLTTLTDAQTGGNSATAATDPPRIVATTPVTGAADVDPNLKEITVTFDREMGGGFSWTGGGPEFPPGAGSCVWRDKTTCVMPVKLEAAHLYRVGINAPSYKNFRSAAGVPAVPTAIYFTTQGASAELQKQMAQDAAEEQNRQSHAQRVDGPLDASQGVWVVRFEPVGDFSPQTPGDLLDRAHQSGAQSGSKGEIGYFRTKIEGGKLTGSFLAYDGDQLKAALDGVPSLHVTGVEQLTQEGIASYEKLPQESLASGNEPDAAKGVWAVSFEPTGDFSPKTPKDFLDRANQSGAFSGRKGQIGYFRTKNEGGRLTGSFLAYDPDQLKAALDSVPGLHVTGSEKLTSESLEKYKALPQESLVDIEHPDASLGVWAVTFEPVGSFAPKTLMELLDRANQSGAFSGTKGQIGYFRTKREGDKLTGAFLAYDPDQLKAALNGVPGLQVTAVDKLTQDQLTVYINTPQEQ